MFAIHWYDLVILFIMLHALATVAAVAVGIVFAVRATARRSPRNQG